MDWVRGSTSGSNRVWIIGSEDQGMGQREWWTGSHNKVRTGSDEGVGEIECGLGQRIKEWVRESGGLGHIIK